MNIPESQVLQEIVSKTQSDLIMFFVLMSVVLIAVLVPFYRIIITDRKERRAAEQNHKTLEERGESERLDKYILREAQIINVIRENSEVIAGLKITLENSGINTSKALDKILDNQAKIMDTIQEVKITVDGI